MSSPQKPDARKTFHPGTQDRFLARLYGCTAGRLLLKLLVSPVVSRAAGAFLSTRLSTVLIKPFIRANGIDMSPYETGPYRSYNAFFSRRIRPECRPIDREPGHLIAPCDSKLTALRISQDLRFTLKNTEYTVTSLLRDEVLARAYEGGYALIFRLTVDDYHRYCYIADGTKGDNVRIPGVLHTVNPIANDHVPIYKENAREYTVLHTEVFGDVVMMEVGALLVGRIVNHHQAAAVRRGEEKGYFQFGGSTVVVLLEKDRVCMADDILENTRAGKETIVQMGERIGCAVLR
jgi:phosphatidylserine decarboxylase